MTTVSGPMFESGETEYWKSIIKDVRDYGKPKSGAHYNIFGVNGNDRDIRAAEEQNAMTALRVMFPDGKADDLNFVLFSTSGVHGSYGTIEDAELEMSLQNMTLDERKAFLAQHEGLDYIDPEALITPSVTFLVVHPRIVCLRYGNCYPKSAEDIAFLKTLRETSWAAVQTIGEPDAEA